MKAGEFIGREFLRGRTIVGDFTTVRQPASPPPAGRELGRPNLPGLPLQLTRDGSSRRGGDFGEPLDKLRALSQPKGSAEPLIPYALTVRDQGFSVVIPAKAGIQGGTIDLTTGGFHFGNWIPAFAGMTLRLSRR